MKQRETNEGRVGLKERPLVGAGGRDQKIFNKQENEH